MIVRRQLRMRRVVIFCPTFKIIILVVHLHELIKELLIQLIACKLPIGVVIVIQKSSLLAAGLSLRVEFIGSVFRQYNSSLLHLHYIIEYMTYIVRYLKII